MKVYDCYWCSNCNDKAWVRYWHDGHGRCENYYSRAPDSYLKSGPEAQCGQQIDETTDFVTWIKFSGGWQCSCNSTEVLVTAQNVARCRDCKSIVSDQPRLRAAIRRGLWGFVPRDIVNLIAGALSGALLVGTIAYFVVSNFWAAAGYGAVLSVLVGIADLLLRKRNYSRTQAQRLKACVAYWEK